MKQFNWRIITLFLFIVTSWGLAWPINKIGLQYVSPLWYTAMRLIIGTLTMMGVVVVGKKFALPTHRDYPLITIVGFLQISLYILLTNLGLAYLPAGRSSLLAYTTPLWVMPMSILFFREEAGLFRWLGFVLGIGGLLLMLSPWQLDWHDDNVIFGSSMLLLASLCWGISILCVRYMAWTKTPLELIPWQLLAGTVPIVLLACFKEPLIVSWNGLLISSLLYTGVLVTGFSYWSGVVINKALPATVISLGFLAVPVFSLLISATFMHETINMTTTSAILLIVLGLTCIAL